VRIEPSPPPRRPPEEPSAPSAFGLRLQDLRRARRLSIRRTALLAGISDTYLSRLERGTVPPPAHSTVTRLAAVLHADVDELDALAVRIPDDIQARVLRRPRLLNDLIRSADRLKDDELEGLIHDLKDEHPGGEKS
jgi:transcriptional regulator with XRE-family HTH domain